MVRVKHSLLAAAPPSEPLTATGLCPQQQAAPLLLLPAGGPFSPWSSNRRGPPLIQQHLATQSLLQQQQQQPGLSLQVVEQQEVPELGCFTVYADGRVRVVFADRTILSLDPARTAAGLILPDGSRQLVAAGNPVGLEQYVQVGGMAVGVGVGVISVCIKLFLLFGFNGCNCAGPKGFVIGLKV